MHILCLSFFLTNIDTHICPLIPLLFITKGGIVSAAVAVVFDLDEIDAFRRPRRHSGSCVERRFEVPF